tara:strand:- start:1034 stop:1300 length:267 start_codon:yes stop_codon:yes gene_type:complete
MTTKKWTPATREEWKIWDDIQYYEGAISIAEVFASRFAKQDDVVREAERITDSLRSMVHANLDRLETKAVGRTPNRKRKNGGFRLWAR